MPTYAIKITQGYRMQAEIVIDIEADSLEEAIEMQAAEDAPNFDDPRWKRSYELENEEVVAAG